MQNFITTILLVVSLVIPVTAKAEVPSGVFGFMDGKFYDSSSTLKYLCFLDNNCYDLQGKFSFTRTAPPTNAPTTPNYEQSFTAEIVNVVRRSQTRAKIKVAIKLQDGRMLTNQTIKVDNYGSFQTDDIGSFVINAYYEDNLKIKFNNRVFELRAPSACHGTVVGERFPSGCTEA